jgi:hypothetical protein
LFSFGIVAAQPTAKELEKHRKAVEQSRSKSKVIISLDTVFNRGKAYCIVKTVTQGYGLRDNYDVYDLEEKNIFFAKANKGKDSYDLVFLDSIKRRITTPPIRYFEDHLVESNFFKNGKLDENAVKKYFLINEENKEKEVKSEEKESLLSQLKIAAGIGNNNVEIVERNRNGSVFSAGTNLMQNAVIIGTFKRTTNSDIKAQITIMSVNNKVIAEGTCQQMVNCRTVNVLTFKDNQMHVVQLDNDLMIETKIAEFLVKYGYL